jgi:hypothetical protein
MKTPTPSAIATAVKNAQRDGGNYILNDLNAKAGMWILTHKKDNTRRYMVDTVENTCECEAFNREGVCKHQAIIDEEIRIREEEERYEISEGEFFFMAECQREQFAEIAGAW